MPQKPIQQSNNILDSVHPDDLVPELTDVRDPAAPPPQPTWYERHATPQLFGGMAKRTGTILTAPGRVIGGILGSMGMPGVNGQQLPFLQEKTPAEKFGGNLIGAAAYAVPATKAGALAETAAGLPGMGLPVISRYAPAISNAIAGGVTNAAGALMNADDPMHAATIGAAIPFCLGQTALSLNPIGQWLKRSAQRSMMRALDPTTSVNKYLAQKVVDPLLKEGSVFASLRGLMRRAQGKMSDAIALKDSARMEMPENAGISTPQVQGGMSQAETRFRPAYNPRTAENFTAGEWDDASLKKLADLATRIRRSSGMEIKGTGAPAAMGMTDEQLMQAAQSGNLDDLMAAGESGWIKNPNMPEDVPFDLLESFKQEWQDYAKRHGKYTGKKFVGMTPESGPMVEASDSMAGEIRSLLEKNAPESWAQANKLYHIWKTVYDLSDERIKMKMAQKVPWAEHVTAGMGAGVTGGTGFFGRALKGGDIRLLRRALDSPLWNSALAQTKNWYGNALSAKTPLRGFLPAGVSSYLGAESQRGPFTSVKVPDAGGSEIYVNPQTGERIRLEGGQWVPVK